MSVKTFDDGVAFELPSARRVSNIMTSPSNTVSGEHTVMVMQMGQVTTELVKTSKGAFILTLQSGLVSKCFTTCS